MYLNVFVYIPCMKQVASKGVVTRSQSKTFCHVNCQNPKETTEKMNDHEDEVPQNDMVETRRKFVFRLPE